VADGPADSASAADPAGPAGFAGSAGAPGAAPEFAAAGVLAALGARGQTLAVAESLTGGLLAATIVDVPGASAVFRGGLVVYATDLKASLAGVDPALLAERGPVDPDVARGLARGAALRCGADWGLATTGVAGPDPQGGVAPGTVYIGLSYPDGRTEARRLELVGDRPAIRRAVVASALTLIAEAVPR
jgi:nicotinamide-nucleotide amidase